MYLTRADGTNHHIEGEMLWRKNGTSFPVEYTSMPIKKDGEVVGAVVAFKNITERLQMAQEILAAKEKAEDATRAKSDFLANMSHEIRTPMNAVIGMTHLALKTDLTLKQQDYLNKIQSSANNLLGIINDILDFSKIEAGKLSMESVEFNLDDVLDNLANLVTVKAREKEELEVLFATARDVPRHLVGDPLRLGQILTNLANNAVKFTQAGEIVISTEVDSRQDEDVLLQFSVRDTGIGLTQEQMDKLFESFSQADSSTTRKFGGTGLGLSISKRLVEMMDGKIWVESKYGRGTTFNFLARFGIGREKLKRRFEGSQDMKGMKVLVVDDNATSRNILNDILESFSFEVHLASTGEDGLEELEKADPENPFDLVLMDWKMPGMDGLETSRRIKTHPHLEKIPAVVMVTAYGREELMQRSERLGLDGFLIKPVNPSVLFDTIMEALGQKSGIAPERKSADVVEISVEIRGAHVLLAEDNEINQQVAYEILQGAGLKVSVVDNGQKAVNAVKAKRYDAVLMDIQMPVMDGHAATREIRSWESKMQNPNSKIESIPIIAMTAHAMAGDEEKSLQAGMNGHVTKPIDPDQLFAELARWISPTSSTQQAGLEAADATEVKTAVEDLPESLPGFDLATGLKRLGGNRQLYRKLLVDFGSQYTRAADEIRVALDNKDYKQAHGLVHNLKGLAGNLEAGDLLSATLDMEALVKTGHDHAPVPEELDASFIKLQEALDQSLAAVQMLGPGLQEESAPDNKRLLAKVPPDVAKSAADRIRAAADIGDVTQISDIANELKSAEKTLGPFCDRILKLADDFDLDGILKLVDEMNA
jgi:signal transduction histidine kinase/CheY-like chemotaxis protein